MRIVALGGSLRAASTNGALLRLAVEIAPSSMQIVIARDVGWLPLFDPDRDTDIPPDTVSAFRALLATADGFLFSTPEYAHGVPGALKNALDWLVSSGELNQKPVASVLASLHGGDYAQASLLETLSVMDAVVVPAACQRVPVLRSALGDDGRVNDPATAQALRACLEILGQAVTASITTRGER
jgi:NAD(P)H-dependent FMN reductase